MTRMRIADFYTDTLARYQSLGDTSSFKTLWFSVRDLAVVHSLRQICRTRGKF
jgi:hypothetical protein